MYSILSFTFVRRWAHQHIANLRELPRKADPVQETLLIAIAIGTITLAATVLMASLPVRNDTLKWVSFGLKYVSIVLTALLSIYSLHQPPSVEHAQSNKHLTASASKYRSGLIALCAITLGSAYLENTADQRIKIEAELRGNEAVTTSLRIQEERYEQSLTAAASDFQDQVKKSQEAQAFSGLEVEHFFTLVDFVGTSRTKVQLSKDESELQASLVKKSRAICQEVLSKEFNTGVSSEKVNNGSPETLEKVIANATGNQERMLKLLAKPWQLPENECSEIMDEEAQWEQSTYLFNSVNSKHKNSVTMELHFDGFVIEGSTSECALQEDFINDQYICLKFILRNRGLALRTAEERFRGPLSVRQPDDLTISLDTPHEILKQLFQPQGIRGRDLNIQRMEMLVCDYESDEPDPLRRAHIQLPTSTSIHISTIAYETQIGRVYTFDQPLKVTQSSFKDYCRSYILRP